MSEHVAEISWARQSDGFSYKEYNREHLWRFEGGVEVAASAAPAFLGKPEFVDPEEAFVASLSSCHMLTFLAIAARKRWVMDSYEDRAVGVMEKNSSGGLAVTRVELRPKITFAEPVPGDDEIEKAHHLAHTECFIANSVLTEVVVVG